MRISILISIIMLATSVTSAQQLGNQIPEKSDSHVLLNPAYDGRQGGETIDDAFPIESLPFNDTGATCDNVDDFDVVCPYGSNSPDVVYSWVSTFDGFLFVDLCGSQYDTKVYMFDSDMNVVECNDDFYWDEECGVYVSALENAPVILGETYFIVVDGYGGDCGEYILSVEEYVEPGPCYLDCSPGAMFEGEPTLYDNYTDAWNGGCNSTPVVFQGLANGQFCGVGGWYLLQGNNAHDTDWFECTASGSSITWTVDAELATNCYQLSIPDCENVGVIQSRTAGPCDPTTMVINTTPGEIIYLWLGSVNTSTPGGFVGNEYEYIFTIEGIEGTVATKRETWSHMKSLYR